MYREPKARFTCNSRFGPNLDFDSRPALGKVDRRLRGRVWQAIIVLLCLFWGAAGSAIYAWLH